MSAADSLSPQQFFHGSLYGGPTDTPGPTGVHVGTQAAASEALNARIGHRADGKDWDGSSEYGKTLLAGHKTIHRLGRVLGGYSAQAGKADDHLPQFDLAPWALAAKPTIFPVNITGPMTNTPQTPREDPKSNRMMARHLKKGDAKRGYFYENNVEDRGSISAVVPNWNHLKDMRT